MRTSRFVLAFVFCVTLLGSIAFGVKPIPSVPRTFVYDEVNLLSSYDQQMINARLQTFQTETKGQMVVAIMASLADEDFDDYVNRMYRAWKLGDAKRNDGVLLVIVPSDRKFRTEVGYGFEALLTDAYTRRVAEQVLVPEIRKNNFAGGILGTIEAYQNRVLKLNGEDQRAETPRRRQIPVCRLHYIFHPFCYL